jgi:AcrR family transcriptional regulator
MTRQPLSRERILRAALGLADESGLEAITMRRLGDVLGFEAMSLYRHVQNKQDVIAGILDLVLEEWETPGPDREDWQAAVRSSAVSVHAALMRHPWAAGALGSHARPARIAYMDRLLGTLREAGFPADETYTVYHVLDGFIFGFSQWQISYSRSLATAGDALPRLLAALPWDELPHLAEHRDQHFAEGPHQDVSAFELGLDLILDGLADRRAEVVESTPRRGVEQSGSSPGS